MSSASLFSTHWHHVESMRICLSDDVKVSRHVYRERVSWVLYRHATGTSYKLDELSFELIDRLDGKISVGEVWELALEQLDQAAPTQDEWMQLLGELHSADLLTVDSSVPVETLFERRDKKTARDRRQRYFNPLYLRYSLFDPDHWLDRLGTIPQLVFSRAAFACWLVVLTIASLLLFTNSERLFLDVSNAARLSPYITTLFIATYPILKILHELGHALAIKRCGGNVHEIGIAVLILLPLPYVDAGASSIFSSKYDRMLVSSAGIMAELLVAAIGVFLWSFSSGLASDVGLVLFISGALSSLLINGNPLLKFDGYYLMADWLEIPNLQIRAKRMVGCLLRSVLSGIKDDRVRIEDPVEGRWLLFYGITSGIYRTGLMLWIAWMLSQRWLVAGIMIAIFAMIQAIVMPLWRGMKQLYLDEQLQGVRTRLIVVSVPVIIVVLLGVLPVPHASTTRGVVWLPEEAVIRAASECEVTDVKIDAGSLVRAGDVLFRCADTELAAQQRYMKARVAELKATLLGTMRTDPVAYSKLKLDLETAQESLSDVQQRISAEQHSANVDGLFDVSGTAALKGQAFKRGEIAAYTIPDTGRTIRLAFPERQIAHINDNVEHIEVRVRTAADGKKVHTTSIRRRSLNASMEVPSAALSTAGGGPHMADPAGNGRLLLHSVIDFELYWPENLEAAPIGEHMEVRFVHAPEPLAGRIVNAVKRALMDRQPV